MKALFIVLDTVRRDYLESYGNSWVKTPNLTKLAQRGVTFDNHWAGSLPCMPARRELMTGRYNFVYRGWGPIEPYDDVLPRWVRENRGKGQGVFSHMLTDHDHYFELGGENYHTAFDTWEFFRGQEVDPWVSLVDAVAMPEHWNQPRDKYLTGQKNLKNRLKQQNEEEFSGPRTVMSAIQWLEDNKNAKGDWFLQVELFDPHEPFYCTKKYLDMYGDHWDGPVFDWPMYDVVKEDPKAIEHIRKCYAGLLTMTDYWVGKLLAKLEEIGQFEDTTIIFTTDHGTLLAERGLWMKNYMPVYGEIAHIPLVIKPAGGGSRAGSRVGAFTQTIDIMPTFVDYFGAPMPPHLHGQSLRPLAEAKASMGRRDGLLGYFGMATNVTDGRHMYMRMPVNNDGGPLHAYTAMPVMTLNRWFPRSDYEKVEMGRYFGHTYNLPLYKIPTPGSIPRDTTGNYLGRHQLFDLQADPGQEKAINNPSLEAAFVERLIAHLAACEAPAEQYTRLGLSPEKA